EFRDGAEDVHLELPGRRRGVDAFAEADERDAERLQVVEQDDQVLQVASEAIQLSADDHIELRPPRILHRRSRAGRLSFVPLTPWSMYSTAVQPRASV